jgi:DNA polymerase-3 subunit beta
VLAVVDGDAITMQMDTPLSPCLIREPGDTGFTCVVMPVKVS